MSAGKSSAHVEKPAALPGKLSADMIAHGVTGYAVAGLALDVIDANYRVRSVCAKTLQSLNGRYTPHSRIRYVWAHMELVFFLIIMIAI